MLKKFSLLSWLLESKWSLELLVVLPWLHVQKCFLQPPYHYQSCHCITFQSHFLILIIWLLISISNNNWFFNFSHPPCDLFRKVTSCVKLIVCIWDSALWRYRLDVHLQIQSKFLLFLGQTICSMIIIMMGHCTHFTKILQFS